MTRVQVKKYTLQILQKAKINFGIFGQLGRENHS